MPRRTARPDAQVARLAAELGRRWVAADGIEPWLRRQLPRLTSLAREEGWSWDDIGRAMTAAGITYATGRPWTGRQLARKAADVRAQLRTREGGAQAPAPLGVWGASERKTYVRPCRATCRGASALCDIYLRQKNARPAWGTVAVAELRSCATAPQILVGLGLHRFSVRLLPRPPLLAAPAAPPTPAKGPIADEGYVEPSRRTFRPATPRGWVPSPPAPATTFASAPQAAPAVDVDAVIACFLGKACIS